MVQNPSGRIRSDDPLYPQYSDPSISIQPIGQLLDLVEYVDLGRLGIAEDSRCSQHSVGPSAQSEIAALLISRLWNSL